MQNLLITLLALSLLLTTILYNPRMEPKLQWILTILTLVLVARTLGIRMRQKTAPHDEKKVVGHAEVPLPLITKRMVFPHAYSLGKYKPTEKWNATSIPCETHGVRAQRVNEGMIALES
ncbi:hypothetical protein VNI00_016694 [Paramarasmius palmivorus]|uniref:Uncharacterized protein n=1 Tax=Paramarasmius palmivorus TaxID=297713 RepID=A0AAW0BCZ0_9AGAR